MSKKRKKFKGRSVQAPANIPSGAPQPASLSQSGKGQLVMQQQSFFQGPLPPPEVLAKYEALYSGVSKMLFDQFQEQGKHRMQLENKVITANIKNSRLGQWMGYSLCLIALLGGGILVCFGIRTEGIIAAVAGLAVLAAVFVTGKFTGQKELRAKRQGQ